MQRLRSCNSVEVRGEVLVSHEAHSSLFNASTASPLPASEDLVWVGLTLRTTI